MKKIACLLTNAAIASLTFCNEASAQEALTAFNPPVVNNYSLFRSMDDGTPATTTNNINIRAVRDFIKSFKNVDNNKWSVSGDGGFMSVFNADGIQTIVVYGHRGQREYIKRIYAEPKLSGEVRSRVRSVYYDAAITSVVEVETYEALVLYVYIQDKNTDKILQLFDGEMKLVQDIKK